VCLLAGQYGAMGTVDYDRRMHEVYAKGRALAPEAVSTWMRAFTRRAPSHRPLVGVDVGSGTGRFTPALAETFGGPVYGVEPSSRMRAVAEREAVHRAVTYLGGSAEAIPLPDRTCDLALLFFVWHHVADRAQAVRELARVLHPGGRVHMRSNFSDRMPELSMYAYFPSAREVDAALYPTFDEVLTCFTSGGFRYEALDVIRVPTAADEREALERLRLRAISTFEFLGEDEIEAGLAAMEAAVAERGGGGPIIEEASLLTFVREG
jgi:ubiquinone/menaquinone biosynthesis C-methylase UbiE